MIHPFIIATQALPHHTQIVSFAIIKLFLLLNTKVKTNHTDSTRSAPLSMNKLTTEYWNSYAIWNSFINVKYRNPRNKTETLIFVICLFGLILYLSAMHRICILAGAIKSATHALN